MEKNSSRFAGFYGVTKPSRNSGNGTCAFLNINRTARLHFSPVPVARLAKENAIRRLWRRATEEHRFIWGFRFYTDDSQFSIPRTRLGLIFTNSSLFAEESRKIYVSRVGSVIRS